jgi:hypothetical protein
VDLLKSMAEAGALPLRLWAMLNRGNASWSITGALRTIRRRAEADGAGHKQQMDSALGNRGTGGSAVLDRLPARRTQRA